MADDEKGTVPATDTPTEETTPDEAAVASEAAQESVDELKERIADFESRLTKEGRSKAQIRSELESIKAEYQEALKANEDWKQWYLDNHATPEEKEQEKSKLVSKEVGETRKAQIERDHYKAMAEEEDPVIRKVLANAAKAGDFMTAGQVKALRESLSDNEEAPAEKKPLVKVSGNRTSGTQRQTLDDQIAEARKSKEPEAFDKLLQLKTEKALASRTG